MKVPMQGPHTQIGTTPKTTDRKVPIVRIIHVWTEKSTRIVLKVVLL